MEITAPSSWLIFIDGNHCAIILVDGTVKLMKGLLRTKQKKAHLLVQKK
jgi:hypothetical protein